MYTLPSCTRWDSNGIGTFFLPSSVPSALFLTSWAHHSRPRELVQHIHYCCYDCYVQWILIRKRLLKKCMPFSTSMPFCPGIKYKWKFWIWCCCWTIIIPSLNHHMFIPGLALKSERIAIDWSPGCGCVWERFWLAIVFPGHDWWLGVSGVNCTRTAGWHGLRRVRTSYLKLMSDHVNEIKIRVFIIFSDD